VIVGAESGRGARPMQDDWVRRIRDATKEAGAAFFFKQRADASGRKQTSPVLDGRTWEEWPEIVRCVTCQANAPKRQVGPEGDAWAWGLRECAEVSADGTPHYICNAHAHDTLADLWGLHVCPTCVPLLEAKILC
jgi:hypothetical protein